MDEKILKSFQEKLEKDKAYLEELRKNEAVLDDTHPMHNAYIGLINSTKGSIKATEEMLYSIENQKEPYQEELLDDIQEIEDSVSKAEADYEKNLKDFEDNLSKAEKYVEDKRDSIDPSEIRKRQKELIECLKDKNMQEFLKDVLSEQDIQNINNFSDYEKIDLDALAKEIQENNPFVAAKMLTGQAKESLKSSCEAINLAKTAYVNAMVSATKIAETKVSNAIAPMVSATGNSVKGLVGNIGGLYVDAMQKSSAMYQSFTGYVNNCLLETKKFEDKFLDFATLGIYSKVMPKFDAMIDKNAPSNRLANFIKNQTEFYYTLAQSKQYWKDIEEDGLLWGKDFDSVSPVTAIEQGFERAKTFFKEKAKAIKDEIVLTANVIEFKATDFASNFLEDLLTTSEKYEKRLQSKVSQLYKADKELYEANCQHEAAMHKLTAITPYEKKPFQPSSHVKSLIANIAQAAPSKNIDLVVAYVNKEIKKEKREWQKQEFKNEVKDAFASIKNTLNYTAHDMDEDINDIARDVLDDVKTHIEEKIKSLQEKKESWQSLSKSVNKKREELGQKIENQLDGVER